MGLPMFREPSADDTSKSTIKVNTDTTARARSSIRRHPTLRHPNRRRPNINGSTTDNRSDTPGLSDASSRSTPQSNEPPPASTDENSPVLEMDWDDENFTLSAAYQWGIAPGSEEHTQLRDFFRNTAPLSRQSRRRGGSGSLLIGAHPDSRTDERRRVPEIELSRSRANLGTGLNSSEGNTVPPHVIITTSSGLGDRRRSFSPEESPWEILRATIQPDERLPSASSSFASTAASTSASLSQERSARQSSDSSPATSVSGPAAAISLYPPQPRGRGPTPHPHPLVARDDDFTALFICDTASSSEDEFQDQPTSQQSPTSATGPPPDNLPTPEDSQSSLPPRNRQHSNEPLSGATFLSPPESPYPRTVAPAAVSRLPPSDASTERRAGRRSRPNLRQEAFLRSRLLDRDLTRDAARQRREMQRRAFAAESERRSDRDMATLTRDNAREHAMTGSRQTNDYGTAYPHDASEDPSQNTQMPLTRWASQEELMAALGFESTARSSVSRGSANRERERVLERGVERRETSSSSGREFTGLNLWERAGLDIDEVEARYARLEEQEMHLNRLLDRLCQRLPVPDSLWNLAGVERRAIEARI